MKKQLLLVSSSRCRGGAYLQHCEEAIKKFIGNISKEEKLAFVPYALKDHNSYASTAISAFSKMGYKMESVHTYKNPRDLINDTSVKLVFIGGGNTFRLLNELHKNGIFEDIKSNVENKGLKYMGSSAGTNMACPTIKTTNDMPIVLPPSFNALGFVDFQINPHFVPGNLVPGHMGETRETRIKEYHEENDTIVIGLTESNWITVDGNEAILHGENESFIFEKNKEIKMWKPETILEHI